MHRPHPLPTATGAADRHPAVCRETCAISFFLIRGRRCDRSIPSVIASWRSCQKPQRGQRKSRSVSNFAAAAADSFSRRGHIVIGYFRRLGHGRIHSRRAIQATAQAMCASCSADTKSVRPDRIVIAVQLGPAKALPRLLLAYQDTPKGASASDEATAYCSGVDRATNHSSKAGRVFTS